MKLSKYIDKYYSSVHKEYIVTQIAELEADLEKVARKFYWMGHTEGRLWGKKAITREEVLHGETMCDDTLAALDENA